MDCLSKSVCTRCGVGSQIASHTKVDFATELKTSAGVPIIKGQWASQVVGWSIRGDTGESIATMSILRHFKVRYCSPWNSRVQDQRTS